METGKKLRAFYEALLSCYGPQGWWPAETPFEVIVGAILTQNTSWTNVEKAIKQLKERNLLEPRALAAVEMEELAELIRPAGYFRLKSRRLKNFLEMLISDCDGDLDALFSRSAASLREKVLSVNGIGPETADSIVLYASGKPVFVIDTYTYRVAFRHGLAPAETTYEELQELFSERLPEDVAIFQEYHALLVRVGKERCKKRQPLCEGCPLEGFLEPSQPLRME
ncbi:MAG: endonuclease III domain-containing protein [Planctomycetia bacterium]|nr:endonuclease III domain-containing protein [Planctomycetia bacterium]